MKKYTGNPTREDVEQHKLENHSCLMCDRIGNGYLRALNMEDGARKALKRLDNHPFSTEDGIRNIRKAFASALKEFDGGGGEEKHELAGEWAGGRSR
jgi:hypothetical protein